MRRLHIKYFKQCLTQTKYSANAINAEAVRGSGASAPPEVGQILLFQITGADLQRQVPSPGPWLSVLKQRKTPKFSQFDWPKKHCPDWSVKLMRTTVVAAPTGGSPGHIGWNIIPRTPLYEWLSWREHSVGGQFGSTGRQLGAGVSWDTWFCRGPTGRLCY